MKKTTVKTSLGEHEQVSVTRLEGNLCDPETMSAWAELITLLRTIVDMPDLLRASVNCPNKVEIKHNGQRWVVESLSIEPRVPNDN